MIYTFYSFKGGVGRSMALANVAEVLYRRGLKVLIVDFDLEAPGLERYFDVRNSENADELYDSIVNTPDEVETKRGLIDLLVSYKNLRSMLRPEALEVAAPVAARAATESVNPSEAPNGNSGPTSFSFPVEPLSNFICQIYTKNQEGGELYIIPAGRRAKDVLSASEQNQEEFARYAERVRSFPWNDMYTMLDGQKFFDWFRTEAQKFADVILIDSRTGVTEMGGICTYHLADVVVMFAAPNKQNLTGTEKIAQSLRRDKLESEGRKGRKLPILVIPSRIDVNEKVELDNFSKQFKDTFDPMLPPELTFREADAFSDLTIRYVPFYSFREEVAVRDKKSPVARILAKVYEEICLTFAKLEPESGSQLRSKYSPEQLTEGNIAEQQNRFAQGAFAQLSLADQDLAPSVLTRLVRLAQHGEASGDTGLRLNIKEFSEPSLKTLRALSEKGLVVIEKDEATGDESAKLAQEGFILYWDRLRGWMDKDRDFLLWRQKFKTNIEQWNNSKREKAALLSGKSLDDAKHWRNTRGEELSDTENLYIVESSRYESKLFIEKIVYAALALLIVGLLGGYLWWQHVEQRKEAERKERESFEKLYITYSESGEKSAQSNDFTSSIDFYSKAAALRPNDAEPFNNRGKAYYMSGQLDAALNDFNRAISLKPDYAEAFFNRGVTYFAINEFEKALYDLDHAISIKPDYAEAYFYRGNVYDRKGDYDSAIRDYERALLLRNDKYPEASFQRGLLYKTLYLKDRTANAEAKDKAIADFSSAINLTDIPRQRAEAMQNLEELTGKQNANTALPSPQPPQVFIHYNSPDDERVMAKISADLQTARITVQGMQTSDSYTEGDVRYYYPEDKKNAEKVTQIVATSLGEQNYNKSIKIRFLGDYYRDVVARGSIEVWIPALSLPDRNNSESTNVQEVPNESSPLNRRSSRRR